MPEYLLSAVKTWIEEWDIDGIRFDAADCLDIDFIKRIHNFTKEIKSDFWLMGEIIHGDYKRWANSEMFDSVTNYQCYKGIYSSHNDRNYFEIAHSIDQQLNQYGNLYLYNFVDNHDVSRLASVLRNSEHIYCCYTLMYMMRGIPSVYYGSEFGIAGEKGRGQNADMPLRPCLELDDISGRNEKLLQHIAALGAIRLNCEPIQIGSYSKLELKNQTFLFKREANGHTIYIALNISDSDYTFHFNTQYSRLADRLTGKRFNTAGGSASITVPSNCSMVLVYDELKTEELREEPIEETVEVLTEQPIEEAVKVLTEQPIEIIEERAEEIMGTPSAGIPEGRKIVIGGHYKHFKGGDYVVLNIARDHETFEEQVVYIAVYGKPIVWVRPLKMFLEDVNDHGNIKPRFQFIQD